MRIVILAFLLPVMSLLTTAAGAQDAAAPKTYASGAEIQAMIAKAKADHMGATIVALAPYRAGMEYRVAASPPLVHQTEAELIYVIEGNGTLTMGGTLTDPKQTRPGNLSGSAITGGKDVALTPGTFVFVPENTPHAFSAIKDTVVDMAFHVPRPVPAAAPAK